MTGDEIVVTMSEEDFDTLREMWMFAQNTCRVKDRDRYRLAITRICHTAKTLSLNWLDKKLEEFA
jgi:hypothetical protein